MLTQVINFEPQLLVSRSFSSFEELAAMVVAWNLDFRQLSRPRSASALVQIQTGQSLFSHLTCGSYSRHAGETPDNCYSIVVTDMGCPPFRYSNRLVDEPAMLITGPGQEFELLARPGYAVTTFSVPEPVIDQYFASGFDQSLDKLVRSSNGVIRVKREDIMEVKKYTRALFRLTRMAGAPDTPSRPSLANQTLESQLLGVIVDALSRDGGARSELKGTARRRVLSRALDYANSQQENPVSVHELAVAARTTERTLERAFKQESGITPKKYLFGVRMSGVHRQLWRSEQSETSVAAVANNWGFWHMGQFAKDYRKLFGELPSATLRRAAPG